MVVLGLSIQDSGRILAAHGDVMSDQDQDALPDFGQPEDDCTLECVYDSDAERVDVDSGSHRVSADAVSMEEGPQDVVNVRSVEHLADRIVRHLRWQSESARRKQVARQRAIAM